MTRLPCVGCNQRMDDIKGKFQMRFIGRPGGVLMKGAPGNYEHGKVYSMPFRFSRKKYWALLEPVPEFVAPEPSDEDMVFAVSEEDDAIFIDSEPEGEEYLDLNFDPEAPAIIEPYMSYSPSTDTLSAYVPPIENLEEEILKESEATVHAPISAEETDVSQPNRDELKKILDEAGVEYPPKTRTATLQKMVDALGAKE